MRADIDKLTQRIANGRLVDRTIEGALPARGPLFQLHLWPGHANAEFDADKQHQICTIVLPTDDGACLRIRKAATPDPDVQELYRHLNISPDILKAQHTWAPRDSD